MPLSDRMPELGSFEVLLAVAQAGSLNAAARELGVTQQAVSARVASLEARAGIRLLTRTAHGSTLTASGVVVVEWADRLMRTAHDVDAGLAALRPDRRARLRISAAFTIAEQLMPAWLVSYQTAPDPRAVLLKAAGSDEVGEDVRAGRAELGFIDGPTVPRGVRSRVIGHDQLCLVVAPEHPWSRRNRPVGVAELLRTPMVARESAAGTHEVAPALRDALGDTAQSVPPVLELPTTAAIRSAVRAGAGPALLSRLAIADDLAAHRLAEVKVTGIDLHRELRAIWMGPRLPPVGAARDLLAGIDG
jgi:DNA-binding transcriptional LysR family regulator